MTQTGEINPFRPGIARILATTPAPVVPMALRGLWGSFFSRAASGAPMRHWRGMFSRIALVAGPPVRAEEVTTDTLFGRVQALRRDAR